ncbi:LOW QUALITY PROTEIN: hypothetical protein OSB04_027418 [Centaurea solstitialis]|uniref:Uncharacterized protein n=1 Tax=Centaurea solstitialis TaxID=347529 RepID=A0AA38SXD0_9ASTR|nr:LOW QUALITY PROTEIN: hypothetical protein OSB04_027418 [Centaurea solstitialis]
MDIVKSNKALDISLYNIICVWPVNYYRLFTTAVVVSEYSFLITQCPRLMSDRTQNRIRRLLTLHPATEFHIPRADIGVNNKWPGSATYSFPRLQLRLQKPDSTVVDRSNTCIQEVVSDPTSSSKEYHEMSEDNDLYNKEEENGLDDMDDNEEGDEDDMHGEQRRRGRYRRRGG